LAGFPQVNVSEQPELVQVATLVPVRLASPAQPAAPVAVRAGQACTQAAADAEHLVQTTLSAPT